MPSGSPLREAWRIIHERLGSLARTRKCKYHVVLIPKYRHKVLFGTSKDIEEVNAYSFVLRWEQLRPLIDDLESTLQKYKTIIFKYMDKLN